MGVAALLCVLEGPVAGENPVHLPREKDKWIRVETGHFTIYSGASESLAIDVGHRLEWLRAEIGKAFGGFEQRSPRSTYVYLFQDEAAFRPYNDRFNGKTANGAGYFAQGRDGNYLAINGALQGPWQRIAYHEYSHYFLENNASRFPLWFQEGFAECYSTFEVDGRVARVGKAIETHVLWLQRHSPIPVRQLFSVNRSSSDYNEGVRQGTFYAESWALVHDLLFDRPDLRDATTHFLAALLRNVDAATALTDAYGMSPEAMDSNIRDLVKADRFRFMTVPIGDLRVDTAARVTPVSSVEVLVRLGDLLSHLGDDRSAEAEAHFRQALRLDPSRAGAHDGLGTLFARARHYDQALTELEQAMALDPHDFRIQFHLGETLLSRCEASGDCAPGDPASPIERIRGLFGRSLALQPEFAEAYVGLGATYLYEPAAAAAGITMMEKAHALMPSRVDVMVNLVRLYVMHGDREKAKAIVDGELSWAAHPRVLEAAQRMLSGSPEHPSGAASPAAEPPTPPAPSVSPTPVPPEHSGPR